MIARFRACSLAGLLIGSFLNVCIYRLPRDLSVVRPRSFCPGCETADCLVRQHPGGELFSSSAVTAAIAEPLIPARYLIVELLTALLFFLIVNALGFTGASAKLCLLTALLVGLTFADLESLILPDEFTLGGIVAGLLFAWFVPVDDMIAHLFLPAFGFKLSPQWLSVAESVIGAAGPAGCLWLGGLLFEKIRHKEGLGLGDVKMMAMFGAFLGTTRHVAYSRSWIDCGLDHRPYLYPRHQAGRQPATSCLSALFSDSPELSWRLWAKKSSGGTWGCCKASGAGFSLRWASAHANNLTENFRPRCNTFHSAVAIMEWSNRCLSHFGSTAASRPGASFPRNR